MVLRGLSHYFPDDSRASSLPRLWSLPGHCLPPGKPCSMPLSSPALTSPVPSGLVAWGIRWEGYGSEQCSWGLGWADGIKSVLLRLVVNRRTHSLSSLVLQVHLRTKLPSTGEKHTRFTEVFTGAREPSQENEDPEK